MNSFRIFCSCAALIAFSGCANHIRNISLKETKIDRKIKKQNYFITLADKDKVIENPTLNIKVEKQCEYQVDQYEITNRKEMFTPYQGWRESYEIPMGITLFPCAIVVNVLDFATLGFIPNSFTDDLLDYSFTGMNPCLNIENEKRVVYKNCETEKKKVDSRTEITTLPIADVKVQLYSVSDASPLLTVRTATDGSAEMNLFHEKLLKSGFHSRRELTLVVMDEKSGKVAETTVLIDRLLAVRLEKAIQVLDKFHAGETPERLAAVVWQLEKLNFPRIALMLEKKTLAAHAKDKTFSKRFAKAMSSEVPKKL